SSRCVYWTRPGPILRRSLVNAAWSRSMAAGPLTRTVPRWLTSNTTAASRHRRCSCRVPLGYASGISQPPKGTIFAPSARCCASRGERGDDIRPMLASDRRETLLVLGEQRVDIGLVQHDQPDVGV